MKHQQKRRRYLLSGAILALLTLLALATVAFADARSGSY